MDWTGLLAWSIDQKKGENFDTSIKPMDEDTKKWLLEALENNQVDEFKRMKEILEILAKPEGDDEEKRLEYFEELMEILDALDRANDFCQLGGLSLMFSYFTSTKFDSIKLECLRIITNCNQNNTFVQEYSGQNGYLKLIDQIGHQPKRVEEFIIAAISSMVRGESLNNKRRFIDLNGITILLSNLSSYRCCEKTANILRDLLYYDDKLHQTYHDISKFSNTTGLLNKQEQYSLTKDVNDDLQKNNELPENQKYRGIVKAILFENKFFKFADQFLTDTSYKHSDGRVQFLYCASVLYQLHSDKEFAEKVKQHYNQLIKEQEKDEMEIQLCKQIS